MNRSNWPHLATRLALPILAIALYLMAAGSAAAATLTVNTTADHDDGTCDTTDCTLREAINHSSSGDTVSVPAGTYDLSAGVLAVNKTLTINGAGARSVTVDAQNASQVFSINQTGANVSISGMTITGGNTGVGGGIGVASGSLTLTEDSVTGNTATTSGGGIDLNGTLTVDRSNISNNKVTAGFGIGGGIDCFCTAVTITNSTLSDNSVSGGSSNQGGGIDYNSGNPLTLLNVTIADNTATSGGGIYFGGPATAKNTIVANNTGGDCANGTITSQGHNLSSDSSCGFTSTGDQQNTDPKLGALQNNGGNTDTRALTAGSPAIDAGDDNGCPATDQRDVTRPQGAHCDIGAFEFQPPPPTQQTGTTGGQQQSGGAGTTATRTNTAAPPLVLLKIADNGAALAHLRRHKIFRVPGVTFYCPKSETGGCDVAATVTGSSHTHARAAATLASGGRFVPPGGTRGLRLALSRAGRRALAARGKLTLVARIAYAAKGLSTTHSTKRFTLVTRRR